MTMCQTGDTGETNLDDRSSLESGRLGGSLCCVTLDSWVRLRYLQVHILRGLYRDDLAVVEQEVTVGAFGQVLRPLVIAADPNFLVRLHVHEHKRLALKQRQCRCVELWQAAGA